MTRIQPIDFPVSPTENVSCRKLYDSIRLQPGCMTAMNACWNRVLQPHQSYLWMRPAFLPSSAISRRLVRLKDDQRRRWRHQPQSAANHYWYNLLMRSPAYAISLRPYAEVYLSSAGRRQALFMVPLGLGSGDVYIRGWRHRMTCMLPTAVDRTRARVADTAAALTEPMDGPHSTVTASNTKRESNVSPRPARPAVSRLCRLSSDKITISASAPMIKYLTSMSNYRTPRCRNRNGFSVSDSDLLIIIFKTLTEIQTKTIRFLSQRCYGATRPGINSPSTDVHWW